ncbi:hypothetical protein Tco_1181765 [Tanacetum coccineum]
MTTLAGFMIIAGADKRPPILKKSMYDSWKSRMELYIENMENGRMILNSILNGPLIWPTIVEENGTTRTKKYKELSVVEKLQADCDLKATNIVLQGLPPNVYAIVNHHKVAKEIWDRVKLLMQGTKLFAQLINNMNVINMSMRPVQVKTKFLNSLPLEWSKFMTDVKLARDLHTTNFDQLYSYLEQHEAHENEPRLLRERYQDLTLFTRKASNDILLKYGMLSSDPVDTSMVDKSKLDKYLQGKPVDPTHTMAKPTEKHLHVVKWIFRYLKGTIDMGLWYSKDSYITLTVYADVDHARCQDTRQSTPGSALFLGDKLCDNKSVIALCCNNVQQSRSKHIDVRYHFIKEQVENEVVELYFFRTGYQLADIFIKALPRERFNFLVEKLGMKRMSLETLKSLAEEEDE